MKIRRPQVLLAVLALAACSDPSGPDVQVAEVRISPTAPSIDIGLFVQFEARAFDAAGAQVTGFDVEWASSDETKATIDATGLATAIGVGTTAITATVQGVSDSEVLIVEPSQCTGRVTVVLNPGEHQAYDGDRCLLLPSGALGDRYRVAITRPTPIADSLDAPKVWLEVNPIFAAAAAPGARPAPEAAELFGAPEDPLGGLERLDGTPFLADIALRSGTRAFHQELRERERAYGLDLAEAIPDRPALAAPALVDPPSRADMYLGLDCSDTTLRPVILIDFDDNLAVYQDSTQWAAAPLPTAATGQMLDYYRNYVVDMIPQYWGAPSDIDGNARIIVVTTPEIPETAAAAVYSGDYLTPAGCASSNQGEVVYFADDVIANLSPSNPDDQSFLALGVLAHEVKHVVSIRNGVSRGAFHPTWIEEGTAEIAQVMSSRIAWAATGGPAIGAEITGNDIIQAVQGNGGSITPEMWGVVGEIGDVIVNLATQPNSLITNPVGSEEFHTFYASSWHWHRFIGDAYGGASTPYGDATMFRALTDSMSATGTGGLAQQTGRSFPELYEDLTVAMSYHKTGLSVAREFSTWNLYSATAIFASPPIVAPPSTYPFPITTNATTENPAKGFQAGVYSCPPQVVGDEYQAPASTDRCAIGASGIRFHEFVSDGNGLGAQLLFIGAPNGTIIVTRLD